MANSFQSLSLMLEKVKSTKKRLEIIEETANYLKMLAAEELEPAVNLMIGRAFPKYNQKTLDVSWSTLQLILEQIVVFDWNIFQVAMAKTGDIGSAIKIVLAKSKSKRQMQLTQTPLTILEVRRTLDAIAQTQGAGSRAKKERQISALLSQASPVEAKYLVKVFTGEMRTGLHEGLMEQSVARAFDFHLRGFSMPLWF
jgi:DNA ligase-1